jgi:hypothetical protein
VPGLLAFEPLSGMNELHHPGDKLEIDFIRDGSLPSSRQFREDDDANPGREVIPERGVAWSRSACKNIISNLKTFKIIMTLPNL